MFAVIWCRAVFWRTLSHWVIAAFFAYTKKLYPKPFNFFQIISLRLILSLKKRLLPLKREATVLSFRM
jgi:hypothetical protein